MAATIRPALRVLAGIGAFATILIAGSLAAFYWESFNAAAHIIAVGIGAVVFSQLIFIAVNGRRPFTIRRPNR